MTKLIPYPKPYRLSPDLDYAVRTYFMLLDGLPPDADALDRPGIGSAPGAADAADRMARDRRPASPEVIGQWMTDLADATAMPVRDALMGRIAMTVRVLGSLPAFCWTEDTLALAAGQFTHYPTVAEIKALLQPIADRHEREIALLREMGRPRPPPVEYRESTVKYVPPFPGDHIGRPGRDSAAAPKGFKSIGSVVADLKPDVAPGEVDLLAARRAKFGQ